MLETYEEYFATIEGEGKIWLADFHDYMTKKHPELSVSMFRQRPMYKFGEKYTDGYILFTVAKEHFTIHILDFELIEMAKNRLERVSFGKGSIKIRYSEKQQIPELKKIIEEGIKRNSHKANKKTLDY